MALEEVESLKGDLHRNVKALEAAGLPPEVKKYLKGTLWPFLEAIVGGVEAVDGVLEEQAEALDELIEESSELLHGETASEIITTLSLAGELAAALKTKLLANDALIAKIEEFGIKAAKVMETVAEISVDDTEAEGDDEKEEDADGDH